MFCTMRQQLIEQPLTFLGEAEEQGIVALAAPLCLAVPHLEPVYG